MSGFRLFDTVFALATAESDFEPVLCNVFGLCPKTETAADVIIGSRFVSGRDPDLAGWLLDGLARMDRSPGLVSMWRGPDDEPAAATFADNVASIAWATRAFDRISVAVWKKDGTGEAPPAAAAASGGGEALARESRATSAVQSVLPPILRELFMRRGGSLAHSAVLLCPNGTGILITAPGGGGKTTTALSVLRKGARLLGDDLNLLEVSGESVTAHGFPEMLNITEATMGFFRELREAPSYIPEDSGSHKKVVSPPDVYGVDCMTEQCRVDVMYSVVVSNEGPRVAPLSASDAFGRLMHAQTFANGQVPDDSSFARLSDILERVKVYELATGGDPEQLGNWLIENCGAHARGRNV